MRRTEREIKDEKEIEEIIKKAQVCRIALCDEGKPYMVPMNFGYKERCLYLHAANEGMKIDIIRKNPNACFEMDVDTVLAPGEIGCKWTMYYKSVIGFGEAEIITESTEKKKGLDIIMKQYAGEQEFDYPEKVLAMMSIIKIPVESITAKQSGY